MIGAAIGGLAQGIGGIISGNAANKTNLKINQMNNDFNREEAEKARQFQLDMWNKENEYNTPAAQRQRLQEGGYNPYFGSDVSSGSATGVSGTTAATAASPIAAQPVPVNFSDSILALTQASKNLSEKEGMDIENLNKTDYLRSQIWKNIGSTDWRNASPEARRFNMSMGVKAAELGMKSLEQQWTNQVWQGRLMAAQRGLYLLDAKSKQILNKYLDQQQLADLNVKAADYELKIAEGQLKPSEARLNIAREIYYAAAAKGQRISNRIAEQTADSIIASQNAANRYDADYYGYMNYNRYGMRHAREDTQTHTWEKEMTGKLLNKAGFDEKMRGWREAIDSANKLIHGVGNGIGAYNDYQNGKYYRGRPYTSDYDEYEEFDKKRGTRSKSRRYRN